MNVDEKLNHLPDGSVIVRFQERLASGDLRSLASVSCQAIHIVGIRWTCGRPRAR